MKRKQLSMHDQVKNLPNLLAFARDTGIPYRTLNRIKADPNYQMNKTTELALRAALLGVAQ